ncbi:phospholipase [Variovorax sp. HJSM1_2]|uniref:phospholipase n=1 Tax=Variovorax sp. HJSM1_2 TaxID=3366263 RepID=UPI003BE80BE3
MQALRLYAGPKALQHLRQHGLQPHHVAAVPAAAGGPKGLILGRLDQFIFGHWLTHSRQSVDLVGASIGAWRMATACLAAPVPAFERLERGYIQQHYEPPAGRKRPSADQVSAEFSATLQSFFDGLQNDILAHPRFRLHIITARGRHVLRREQNMRTHLGYAAAFVANGLRRRALGAWMERVVFSSPQASLPFAAHDFPTRQVVLQDNNFLPALQASCSIPFVLRAVHDIPGAPRGAYWDGGITDYHLHLDYQNAQHAMDSEAAPEAPLVQLSAANGLNDAGDPTRKLVLYPHFQQAIVPGWLDKTLHWRHKPSAFLDNMLVLAPAPEWVATLPNGKLPDRHDFVRYADDLQGRIKVWGQAVAASQQLADEFAEWWLRPDLSLVQPL